MCVVRKDCEIKWRAGREGVERVSGVEGVGNSSSLEVAAGYNVALNSAEVVAFFVIVWLLSQFSQLATGNCQLATCNNCNYVQVVVVIVLAAAVCHFPLASLVCTSFDRSFCRIL